MREPFSMDDDPFAYQELDIGKNVRLIESLKTELAGQLAMIYKELLNGSEDQVAKALAGMMINCYCLGIRLGISPAGLDRALSYRLKEMIHEDRDPGRQLRDLRLLSEYIDAKMR